MINNNVDDYVYVNKTIATTSRMPENNETTAGIYLIYYQIQTILLINVFFSRRRCSCPPNWVQTPPDISAELTDLGSQ